MAPNKAGNPKALNEINNLINQAPVFHQLTFIDNTHGDFTYSLWEEFFTKPHTCRTTLESLKTLFAQGALKGLTDKALEELTQKFTCANVHEASNPLYTLLTRSAWTPWLPSHKVPYYVEDGNGGWTSKSLAVSALAADLYHMLRDEWLDRKVAPKKNPAHKLNLLYAERFTADTTETRRWFARSEAWIGGVAAGTAAAMLTGGIPLIIAAAVIAGFLLVLTASWLIRKTQHAAESKVGAFSLFGSKPVEPVSHELTYTGL